MATVDVVRDAPPMPQNPIDESVKIPDSVKKATADAEALHRQHYPKGADINADIKPADGQKTIEIVELKPDEQPDKKAAAPVSTPAPQPAETVETPPISEESWQHRFLSMKGRFDQSQKTVQAMQQQMQELGDELLRRQTTQKPGTPELRQHLITKKDEEFYGEELIDFARRAAMDTVAPALAELQKENQTLKQDVTQQKFANVWADLDRQLPNWQEINTSPRFVQWLSLRDIYSGNVRHSMLNEAFQAASVPRVLAFFKGFLAEEAATGQGQQVPAALAPRQAAVPLETLAAPGRAHPAAGGVHSTAPVEKPVFTHAQIAAFYSNVRKGAYAGRETEKAADEAMIFAAQAEGRIR